MRFNDYLVESFEDRLFKVLDDLHMQGKIELNVKNLAKIADAFETVFNARIDFVQSDNDTTAGLTSGNHVTIAIPTHRHISGTDLLGTMFHELAHVRQNNAHMHFSYKQPNDDSIWGFAVYFLQPQERPTKAISVAMSFIALNIDPQTAIKLVDDCLTSVKDLDGAITALRSAIKSVGWTTLETGDIYNFCLVYTAIKALSYKNRGGVPDKNKQELRNQWYVFYKNFRNSYKKLKFYIDKYGIK
jgi:hypothetical protein